MELDKSSLMKVVIVIVTIMLYSSIGVFAEDASKTEAPYFAVFTDDSTDVAFPLISTNVYVTISGVIANVEIEQVYENSGENELDATYVFPMSHNAAIYGMQMIIGDRVIDAVIKEKKEAQAEYDSANSKGYTATLLEQHRPNVFQMSVANIGAGESLRVLMKYTELIVPEKGIYQFVFPNIVGPRFTTDGESWVQQSIEDSLAVKNTELNIDMRIYAGMPLSVDCKSHEINFDITDNIATGYIQTHPGADFIVDYELSGSTIQTGLLLYESENDDEKFFLSIVQPPRPEVNYETPKREYVFIMDVSGSMSGTPIEISKNLILNLLDDLNSKDKFNILFFAAGSSFLSPSSLPVTPDNINKAGQMIDNIQASGGTQLLPALQQALAMEIEEDYSRIFVILTDGYVTVEKQAYELIRNNLGEANFFAFGIGEMVNREIIDGMAYVGIGESFVATDFSDAQTMADDFKVYIERPAMTNLKAMFSDINAYDIEPPYIPDVFADRPVIVYGKYDDATNGTIELSGDLAEEKISETYKFSDYLNNADQNIAIKYLWARTRIKLLSDYGLASNEDDEKSIEEEIIELGLKYGLVTEFTSFVAIDSSSVAMNSGSNGNGDKGDNTEYFDDMEADNNDAGIISIVGSNPVTSGILRLRILSTENINPAELQLRIVSLDGSEILRMDLNESDINNDISTNISQLSSGEYLVYLISEDSIVDVQKFIVIK